MQMVECVRPQSLRQARPVIGFEQARSLVAEHGSPLLVVGKSKLIDTYWAMKNALVGIDLYYAAKANPDPHILSTLCAENAFVDVCSEREMQAALEAGFSPERMLHTHPCKTESNFRSCYQAGLRWFVFDNVNEAEKLAAWEPGVSLLLRVATPNSSSLINLSAKFGAPLEQAHEVLETARRLGLNVRGFSFHVGSQCLDPQDYSIALASIRGLWDEATEMGFALEVLDIGGGLPAPYRTDVPPIEVFGGAITTGLAQHFGGLGIRVIAEPGRGLCAESTTLITQVIGKSRRWDRPWFTIDDGLYGSFSGKVFDHCDFPIWYEGYGQRAVEPCVVAGPTCDSGDVISNDQALPDLQVGELLLIPCMGAYAGASASPFNGLPVAKSVAIF